MRFPNIRSLVILFCLCVSSHAFAADYTYGNAQIGYGYTSAGAACAPQDASFIALRPTQNLTATGAWKISGGSGWGCYVVAPNGQYQQSGTASRMGDGCALPKLLKTLPNGDESCELPPQKKCTAGEKWVVTVKGGVNPSSNNQGCEATIVGMLVCWDASNGVRYCKWEMQLTGNPASPNVPDNQPGSDTAPPQTGDRKPSPPTPAPDGAKGSCPAGTVQAGISESGVPLCVGMGSTPDNPKPPGDKTTKPPVVTNNQDGSSTSKQDVTVKNADGSTTTTTTSTTTLPDGTKVVTVSNNTTPALDGGPGKSDEGAKDGICAQNPSLTICKTSSVSGTCGQISCNGDAIQCATLRAAAIMECRQKEDVDELQASPSHGLGKSILAGADPMKAQIDQHMKGTEIDVSNPNLDRSGFLGGGSCLAPISVNVLGRTATYSFATLCDNITPLRYLIMGICSLVGYLIVARSVIGG